MKFVSTLVMNNWVDQPVHARPNEIVERPAAAALQTVGKIKPNDGLTDWLLLDIYDTYFIYLGNQKSKKQRWLAIPHENRCFQKCQLSIYANVLTIKIQIEFVLGL